ncbi:hypothetical protein G7075_16530 [Phycicoccus sp. HDW14]|uniref:Z1 domain-containing protein n=1 Tax=Phycicoccus sp. HDW14 TaxID=2714941 RepID=UPI00140C52D9|nr:Z1 domain-containing protein [Phycicoccus sp. HDW14]QIM22371.1 hypothetical protein G7075_16530 [Phycicoccus sp. HDW14]
MNVFREQMSGASALDEYLEVKRREFIGASGDEFGAADASQLREDIERLDKRVQRQLVDSARANVSYLVMGRVQSGKTGHQLGMLAWAADKCDVAVIFTGVTEALNGQTSYRIRKDLGTLPSNPVATLNVPTRANAERDSSFLESILKRTKQRRDFRDGQGIWPERLPVLVSMKTKPRVDALKWMFQEVAARLGEGVTALIIDDEADQASPNAATRKNEEAATYAELKGLRDAATHHVWLSYTATPQAIFLTERDGALRPDYCAVSQPGAGYFGVAALMDATHRTSRIPVEDWVATHRNPDHVPSSLKRALCDLLVAAWLRNYMPDAFYWRVDGRPPEGMRSVQMLVHTSSKVLDHAVDYATIENGLAQIRSAIEEAVIEEKPDRVPPELIQAVDALAGRVHSRTGGTQSIPQLGPELLWQVGNLISRTEMRVVNSDPSRPTAPAGPLPTDRADWEAHPIWIVIGGDILGRGLTIPQLVTTYFTRLAQAANEDTVSQQMRFCGYRGTYAHVITVHALPEIFESFDYLAQVERALISTAEDWDEKDKNLRLDEPALWYVSRPTNRMKPTRLAVRDRELVDANKSNVVLTLRQFVQPSTFAHNARELLDWVERREITRGFLDDWLLAECGAEEFRVLLGRLKMVGRDDASREVAAELMNPRLGDLGLANLPFAMFVRGLDVIQMAAAGVVPSIGELPVRRLAGVAPSNAGAIWEAGWTTRPGLHPEQWFDSAQLAVPHVGDAQRRPVDRLGYDAVSAVVEPLAGYSTSEASPVGAGLAISITTPEAFELRAIGVKAGSA